MSKIIATAAIKGAYKYVKEAEEKLKLAIESKGESCKVEYPDTAYYLPIIYAFLGIKVKTLGDMKEPLRQARQLLPPIPAENLWLPYLGDTLDAGIATLIAQDVIEALKFVMGPNPIQGIWLGPTTDSILRTQGIKLVDGRMPGFAACVGALPTNKEAVQLASELREKNILVFLSSSTDGKSMAEQLAEEGIDMNWDTFLVPYGRDTSATVHALGFAVRSAMTFGGITPRCLKEAREILLYNKNRVHAFVLALGEVDEEKYATAAGAINFGFPVIADTGIPQILPTGICTYEHVVSNVPHDKMVSRAVEVRGLKLKVTKLPIPVSYGAGFEGERDRRQNMHVQFGGKYSDGFEWVRSKPMDEVEDGKIELLGPDIDSIKEGGAMPLGILVDVAGRKMQKDFESVLERHIHHFLSCASGIMHTGQRSSVWIRISKDTFKAGLRLRHFGDIIRARFLDEFPAIVDKVQVKIFTNEKDIQNILKEAEASYNERDMRVSKMTDEDVDTFYSCTLCQSYAPAHVCIVTPERLGLCGAYNWLDCKASFEINPHGHNQPVKKGEVIDGKRGQWKGVNEFIYPKSNYALQKFNAYSIVYDPMTSCGCFECITAVLPEANGVMIVNREYSGETPIGMGFSTLAGSVGGGQQAPGFIGIGKLYITSKKFISADGGIVRIVWMPKELKEEIKESFLNRANEVGVPDLLDKIADETITTSMEQLIPFLEKVGHPALVMEPIM